ncbi:hypothetical protein GGF31_001804 [Allomyces arbusculus]|nr:hypothetical protein GGF31_001804 [Allomyces arbusculus]
MDARTAPASTMPPPQPAPLRPALPVDPLPAPFNSSLPPAWASWVEQLIVHHVHHFAMTQAGAMHDTPSSSRAPAAAAAADTSGHDSGNDGSPDPPPTGELHTPADDARNTKAPATADPHPESVSGLAVRVHDLELMVHELQTVVGALRRDMYPFKAAHEKKYSRIISHVRKLQMSLHEVGNQVDDLLGPEPVQDATDGPTGPRVRIQLPDGGPPVLTSADPELRPQAGVAAQQGAASALQDLQYLLIHHDDPAFTEQLRMQVRREHDLAAATIAAGPVVSPVESQQQQPWWVTAPVPAAAVSVSSAPAPAQAPPATWYPDATAPPSSDPVARAAEHHLQPQFAPSAAAGPVAPESRLADKADAVGIVPPHSPRAPSADMHHLPTPPQEHSAPPVTMTTTAAVPAAPARVPLVHDTPPSSASVASSTSTSAPASSAPPAAPAGPHVSSLPVPNPAPLTPTPPGSVDTLARAGLAKVATMIRMFDRALAPRQAVLIPSQDDDEDRPLAVEASGSELAPPTRPLPPPPTSSQPQGHVLAWPSLAESTSSGAAARAMPVPARGGTSGRRSSS